MIESASGLGLPLRWAGGKRALVPILKDLSAAVESERLIDPFVGGGSFVAGFHMKAKLAADTNADLINFYEMCQSDAAQLCSYFEAFVDSSEQYYRVRAERPTKQVERAARFVYLNRTAYMGLHRTNQKGDFNVPYGGGGRLDVEILSRQVEALAKSLQGVEIRNQDFRVTLESSRAGDLVILDPPYGHTGDMPFRRYGRETFSFNDHKDLATIAISKARIGALVAVTLPSDHSLTCLYPGWIEHAVRSTRKGSEVLLVSEKVQTAPRISGTWRV